MGRLDLHGYRINEAAWFWRCWRNGYNMTSKDGRSSHPIVFLTNLRLSGKDCRSVVGGYRCTHFHIHRDYRGLKKCISAIRRAHQSGTLGLTESNEQLVLSPASDCASEASVNVVSVGMLEPPRASHETISSGAGSAGPSSSLRPGGRRDMGVQRKPSREDQTLRSHSDLDLAHGDLAHPAASHVRIQTSQSRRPAPARATTVQGIGAANGHPRRMRSSTFASTLRAFTLPRIGSFRGTANGTVEGHGVPRFDLGRPIPLIELLPQLTAVERAFFEKLDAELDKVESFYSEREKDMHLRSGSVFSHGSGWE